MDQTLCPILSNPCGASADPYVHLPSWQLIRRHCRRGGVLLFVNRLRRQGGALLVASSCSSARIPPMIPLRHSRHHVPSSGRHGPRGQSGPERQRALPEPVTLLPEPAMQTVTSFHEELAPLSAFSLSRRTLFCLASAHLTLSSARIKSRTPRRACRRAACTLAYQPLSARGHGPLLQAGRSCL